MELASSAAKVDTEYSVAQYSHSFLAEDVKAVASMGEKRGVCRVLVGRPEKKKPLARPRHNWEDNIKMYLQEVGWEGEGHGLG
jgi:hypothetical protein